MRKIIIGVGSHAEIIASILKEHGEIFNYVSYNCEVKCEFPEYLGEFKPENDCEYILAIGDNVERNKVFQSLPKLKWFNAISSRAHVAENVVLGVGNTICSGSVVATKSVVGDHCILNTNSNIDHHNKIGSFVHIGPSTSLCGNVQIFDGVFLGVGCSVVPRISIRPWSFYKAHSLITTSTAPIPMYEPFLSEKQDSIITAWKSSWISSQGVYLEKTRDKLQQIFQTNVLLVNNGTSATHCLFLALKFKHNVKKIYLPDYVYVAVWNCALYEYKKEELSIGKVDPKTWNLDFDWIVENAEPNSAVVVVHNVGNIFRVDLLKSKRPDLIILEDLCEGLFGKIGDRFVGSDSFCSSVSFFANKTITSGEGGAVLTNDAEVYQYLKKVHNQGNTDKRYIHDVLGYNYRMTNLQASLLYDQLGELDTIIQLKKKVFDRYKNNLKGIVKTFKKDPETQSGNWIISFRLPGKKFNDASTFFSSYGIDIRPFFYPITVHKHLEGIERFENDIKQEEIIMFPSSPNLKENEIDEICKRIIQFHKMT